MNEQCKFCIHADVCAYKEHYEDAVSLYEKARNECRKYPWFKCKIECVKYQKSNMREKTDLGDYPNTMPNQFDNMTGSMNL